MINLIKKLLSHTSPSGDCLVWQRCFNTDGYPRISLRGNSNVKVHRLIYELYNKEDISGLVVRHSCDNKSCINPEHLSVGTNIDNVADRVKRKRCHNYVSDVESKSVVELSIKGLTQAQIGYSLGIPKKRVEYILNKNRRKP